MLTTTKVLTDIETYLPPHAFTLFWPDDVGANAEAFLFQVKEKLSTLFYKPLQVTLTNTPFVHLLACATTLKACGIPTLCLSYNIAVFEIDTETFINTLMFLQENAVEALSLDKLSQLDARSCRHVGQLLMQFNRLEEAKCALNHAITLNPEDVIAYQLLGCIFTSEGVLDSASKYNEIAIDIITKKAADVFYNQAGILIFRYKQSCDSAFLNGALSNIERFILLRPEDTDGELRHKEILALLATLDKSRAQAQAEYDRIMGAAAAHRMQATAVATSQTQVVAAALHPSQDQGKPHVVAGASQAQTGKGTKRSAEAAPSSELPSKRRAVAAHASATVTINSKAFPMRRVDEESAIAHVKNTPTAQTTTQVASQRSIAAGVVPDGGASVSARRFFLRQSYDGFFATPGAFDALRPTGSGRENRHAVQVVPQTDLEAMERMACERNAVP